MMWRNAQFDVNNNNNNNDNNNLLQLYEEFFEKASLCNIWWTECYRVIDWLVGCTGLARNEYLSK